MGNGIINILPVGGSSNLISGWVINVGGGLIGPGVSPVANGVPTQILGLIPLWPCGYTDCRATPQIDCYFNIVFGIPNGGIGGGPYSNDESGFYVDFAGNTGQWMIQRATDGSSPLQWNNMATVTNNTYGTYYTQGTIPGQPTYGGFIVDWGKVITHFGAGIYRIVANTCVSHPQTQALSPYGFGVSPTTGTVAGYILVGTQKILFSYNVTIGGQNGLGVYLQNLYNSTGKVICTYASGGLSFVGVGGAASNGLVLKLEYTSAVIAGWSTTLEGGITPAPTCTCLFQSDLFQLKPWDCFEASGTVKFEMYKTGGTVGDINNKGSLFDLSGGFTYYDSIRFPGFFGYSKFTYDEVMEEWGVSNINPLGLMVRVRDKIIENYTLNSFYLPSYIHKRFAAFALMSDKLLASDYNIANSDWFINRIQVIKHADYKPEYLNKNNFQLNRNSEQRRSKVSMEFLEGIQSGIVDNC